MRLVGLGVLIALAVPQAVAATGVVTPPKTLRAECLLSKARGQNYVGVRTRGEQVFVMTGPGAETPLAVVSATQRRTVGPCRTAAAVKRDIAALAGPWPRKSTAIVGCGWPTMPATIVVEMKQLRDTRGRAIGNELLVASGTAALVRVTVRPRGAGGLWLDVGHCVRSVVAGP